MNSKLKQFFRNWISAILPPRQLLAPIYLPRFVRDWILFSFRAHRQDSVNLIDTFPCLTDWVSRTPFDPHYFYQGAWLARKLAASKPSKHIDVGSSVLMLSVLSAIVDITFVDYRPLQAPLPGLSSLGGNITNLLFNDDSIESLSCLHVIEHIGLGRYGDPLDPRGSEKAAAELQRILQPGGSLFVSVPVGKERVCFNAHRIHSTERIIDYFNKLELIDFSIVDDEGTFHDKVDPCKWKDLSYACGMFHFRKRTI